MSSIFVFTIIISFYSSVNALDLVTVSTEMGDIQGFHVDYGNNKSALYYGSADVFLGIPFVEPPVNDLRFAKPKALTKYPKNPWNATEYKSSCPQVDNPLPFLSCAGSSGSLNEDCLYLNVFTPSGAKAPANRAVMVFIHGGSFQGGCATDFSYHGAARTFVSQDVIVVTIQYRLGFWGFFTTLTDDFPANRGLLDQIEALKWIQKNIANFGGDPKRVTIFGESAGAGSVSAHSFSPLSRGLFQQTIQESGTLTPSPNNDQSIKQANEICQFTAEQFARKNFTELTSCLKEKTVAEILKYNEPWNLMLDESSLPGDLDSLAKARPNYPALIGNMRDEYSYFLLHYFDMKVAQLKEMTRKFVETTFREQHPQFGERLDEVLALVEQTYQSEPLSDNDNIGWTKMMSDIYTGELGPAPMQIDVDYYLANGNPNVFLWEQAFSSNVGRIYSLPGDWDPVPHGAELWHMWLPDSDWKQGLDSNQVIPFDYDMINWYSNTWTTFAKSGKPTTDNSWEPVGSKNRFFRLDRPENGGMKMTDNWRKNDSLLWNTILPTMIPPPSCQLLFAIDGSDSFSSFQAEKLSIQSTVTLMYTTNADAKYDMRADWWQYGSWGSDLPVNTGSYEVLTDFYDKFETIQQIGGNETIVEATSKLTTAFANSTSSSVPHLIILYTSSSQKEVNTAGAKYSLKSSTIAVHRNDGVDMSSLSIYPSPSLSDFRSLANTIITVCNAKKTLSTRKI